MRITTCLLLLCVFCSYAGTTHSQNARVHIHETHTELNRILDEIEKQTDYLFIYDNEVNVHRKVSVDAKNEPVSEVMKALLKNTDIVYSMEGTHIILSTKERKAAPVTGQAGQIVTGTVTDSKGKAIIGANISVKGTTTGTITDIDGRFTLRADARQVLRITYVGYLPKDVAVGNQKTLRIVLTEDTKALDEVVVIGYGTQKKADLTGAVANISTDKLNIQSNINIGQALQGKIAGVDIVSQGGAPGSGSRIMIRGIGTLNNAAPLYIIDGMYMNSMDHINPNDIASIDVLKDASSAAIYGSRAANGVIIITTKSGSDTQGKPMIDVTANVGVSIPSKYLDMLNAAEWAEVMRVSREAVNKSQLEMALDLNQKEDNDWQSLMMGPALTHNYNLSIKGGTKQYTYYSAIGYYNQDGTLKSTNYERLNGQFKSDYKKGWFSLGNNVVLTYEKNNPVPSNARGDLLGVVLQNVPTVSRYDESRVGGYGATYGEVTNIENPLGYADRDLTRRDNQKYRAYINLYAQLELPFGLKYRLNATPDFYVERAYNYTGIYDMGLCAHSITEMNESRTTTSNMLVENLLSFDRTFGDHKVSALIGYSYQNSHKRYLYAAGQEMPDGIYEIDAATSQRINKGNSSENTLTSIISRVFYSYKNKYLVSASLRRDASSKFAKGNRTGNFPSVSAGWNMAEENFLRPVTWLDQLKLRGGYGVLGNQEIDNYMYTATVSSGINYPDGKGGLLQGAFPKEFANPNIKWEETSMINFGLDAMALNGRLTFTGEYYIKKTQDILLSIPITISSGGSNDPVRNAGEIENKGFEFSIGWKDAPTRDFSYGINLVGNYLTNNVTKMGSGSQVIWGGANRLNINTCKTLQGYPIGGFWLIRTDGYFQNEQEVQAHNKDGVLIQGSAKPGDIRFVDNNKDGKITDDDRVYCGSPFPKFTMGLNADFTYKNVDLVIGFQGNFGNKIYNATRQELEGANKGTNFLKSTLDYWTPDNPNAAHPRLIWDDPNRNVRPESDRYLENGSFFRIRNLQIGYRLPVAWFRGIVQYAKVYANIDNLVTFTDYSGYTPDVNNSGSLTGRGYDNFVYPASRTFMLGVNLSF